MRPLHLYLHQINVNSAVQRRWDEWQHTTGSQPVSFSHLDSEEGAPRIPSDTAYNFALVVAIAALKKSRAKYQVNQSKLAQRSAYSPISKYEHMSTSLRSLSFLRAFNTYEAHRLLRSTGNHGQQGIEVQLFGYPTS